MAHIEKRGPNRWRARIRKPDGREISKTFARRDDAKAWVVEQDASMRAATWVDPARGRMTFREWVERWEPTTVDLRVNSRGMNLGVARKYLVPRFGDWPLSASTSADVRPMVAEELEAWKLLNSAIRRHEIVLGVILEAALDDGRVGRNPVRKVKLPPEEARTMRFLEHDGTLAFGPPKTKAAVRTVTMPAALTEILGPHLGSAPVRPSGLAFPGPTGAALRRGNFRRIWRKANVRAGFDPTLEEAEDPRRKPGPLEGLVFHELRQTAAALAIAEGAHPLAIKERLGHSSITVTLDTYGGAVPAPG